MEALQSLQNISIKKSHFWGSKTLPDGMVHVKTIPETIVLQCLGGAYGITIKGEYALIKPGDITIIPPMIRVRIVHHADEGEEHMAARWVHMAVQHIPHVDIFSGFDFPIRVAKEQAGTLNEILDNFQELGQNDDSLQWQSRYYLHTWSLINELLNVNMLLRERYERAPLAKQLKKNKIAALQDKKSLQRLAPVFHLVDRHIEDSIEVEDMAAAVHLSVQRFHVFFKEIMNMTPKQWLKEVRLKRSMQELLTTEESIQRIATACGFKSQFHFSRLFKEYTGMSPREWRVEHLGHVY